MREIPSRILNHFRKLQQAGLREIVLAVLLTSLLTTIIFIILDIDRSAMIFLSILILVAVILAYAGMYTLASWGGLCAGFVILSFLIYSNNGIRDTGVMGLIVLLIAAGLLAGKSGTLIIGALIIFEINLLGVLEANRIVVNQFSKQNFLSDYITLSLIIGMVTLMQWLVISRLDANIQQAKNELQDKKRVEVQLRNAEARYRNLVENIPLVIYISEPGASGVWQYVGPQIAEMTGYTPDEWIIDPRLWYSRIHPDDREVVINAESKALQNGKMPQMEYRLIRRDGRVIWVYDESMVSIDNDDHKLVQGFLLDITARKIVEEQLNRRLAELQAVHGVSEALVRKTNLQKLIVETGDQIRKTFKANNVLIAIHDPSTNLIHFPYDYEDGKLRKDKPIRYGEGMTTQIMEMKKPLIIAENWRGVSAQYNAIYTNINPIKSSFSVPIMTDESVIGVITLESSEQEHAFTENDVLLLSTISSNLAVAIEKTYLQDSLKRELEIQEKLVKELESKNQELEHFTYTASHDLKSPLITIRGFLGYLEKDARAGNFERLEKDIQRISDATEKMHRLLSELLELSRVGKPMNEKKNVSFQSLVMKALQQVEGQIMERQVAIKVGSDFPSVYVDEERMIEALQNLFDNALKFMGDQPKAEIEINHLSQDNTIVYFIKDNGIGIKKEFQERVFGLFDKLNTNSPGTGIGLAIVRRIIEMHGGKIWIESDGSSGTTFFFTLPETN